MGVIPIPEAARIKRPVFGFDADKNPILYKATLICVSVCTVIGAIAIIGWISNQLIIDRVIGAYVPIAFSSAIFITVLSLTLFTLHNRTRRAIRSAAIIGTLTVLLLSLWFLLEGVFHTGIDIEAIIDPLDTVVGEYHVGRASPISTVALIMASLSILMISRPIKESKISNFIPTILSMFVVSIGAVTTTGYLYGNPLLYGETIRPVALLASVSMLLLGAGIILARGPEYWPLNLFIGSSVRAHLLRSFVPLAVSVVFFEGLIIANILQSSSQPVIAASFIALLTIILMGFVISRIAVSIGGEIDRSNASRIKAENKLRQANEKLKVLDTITRHDALNQLTVLIGRLGQLKISHLDPSLNKPLEESLRSANNIEMILRFAREYQNIGIDAPDWIEVKQAFGKAVDTIGSKEISIEAEVDTLYVLADRMFEKVFINLLDNSMRHGEHVKHIKLSYRLSENEAVILFEDDGVGITDSDKRRLFERGFGKHTGFGMNLSREILGYTGITIIETGIPGKGVRFEIHVPRERYRIASGANT